MIIHNIFIFYKDETESKVKDCLHGTSFASFIVERQPCDKIDGLIIEKLTKTDFVCEMAVALPSPFVGVVRLFARNYFTPMATPRCASRLSELLKQSIYMRAYDRIVNFFRFFPFSFFLASSRACILLGFAVAVPADCGAAMLRWRRDRRQSWKDTLSFVSRLSRGILNDARKYFPRASVSLSDAVLAPFELIFEDGDAVRVGRALWKCKSVMA